MDSNYVAEWFHEIIADKLEEAHQKVLRGEKARIILTIPPRHGKTQLSSIFFPAWVLGKTPKINFILSTYGAELSEKVGQSTRDIIASEQYQNIFNGISLRQDTKAKRRWATNKGGSFTAVGIGTAVTGTGGDIILIDDPHKDRAEAESPTVREHVYEYYRSTLYSRLEGFGAVIIIMQRWHADDLVGRLLEKYQEEVDAGQVTDEWEIINFPAIAETDEHYNGELVRKAGEPLWKEKFPLPVLENIRETQGAYNWSSQYAQDPVHKDTAVFQEEWFRTFEEKDLQNKFLRYTTTVDPAIGQKDHNDNTVVLTVAKEVGTPNVYRIREDAGKFTPTQTVELIFKHAKEFNSDVFVETIAYQQALKFAIEERMRKDNFFFTLKEIKSHRTTKEARIEGLEPLYRAGIIFHRPGSDTLYEKELLHFPNGKHDDRIDCMAMQLDAMQNTNARRTARQYKPGVKGYFQGRVAKPSDREIRNRMQQW